MNFNISSLPENIKLEVSKSDLVEFAKELALKLQPASSSYAKEKDIVEISEAALITGLARQTIYALTSNRKIPHFKRGKKLWFRRSELCDWLLTNKRKTVEELQHEAATLSNAKKTDRQHGK